MLRACGAPQKLLLPLQGHSCHELHETTTRIINNNRVTFAVAAEPNTSSSKLQASDCLERAIPATRQHMETASEAT
jgi:hypothetical protein